MRRLPYSLLASVTALSFNVSAATDAAFTIEDLPKVQHAGSVTVSSDGALTAYTLSVPRDLVDGDDNGRPDTHLYLIKGDDKPVRYIGTEGSVSGLQFSADNTRLYFRTKRDGDDHTALYEISVSGGEAHKVFEFESSISDYALSPDGSTLYFVAKPEKEKNDLKDKGFKAYAYEEDDRMASIWKVSLAQTDAEAETLFSDGHVSQFDLSDDGNTIVAAVAPTNLIDDHYMARDLHIIDVADASIKTTVNIPGKLGPFEFSDNGESIALLAGTDIHDSSDGVLMVADSDSGSLTQLTKDALQHVVDVDWLSNEEILAVSHRSVESAMVVYNTKGQEVRTIATPDDILVRSTDVGADVIRFIADSPRHPREVFGVNSTNIEKLSDHNGWLKDKTLAEQTTFSYQARDGETIDGVLITPAGEMPDAGWPLILTVHGGPEAHYSDGWLTRYSMAGQFGAAQGYAVFYPNYRGSTGRGVAFAKQHQNDYAGKEFNDLVDGVKALAKAGIVDEDRVGITGGSYGGYASMWGATALSEHFAAAVAFVGISNQVSKFGTSDIPKEMHLVHSLKWPWEDNWMNLIERSPVFHAGKSTTPILILHGEKDTRVHPSQSMELFRSIKVRTKTPVRLVFYPDEAHGNRKAAAQYDYALRLMRWMDTYLAEDATRDAPMPEFDLGMKERLKPETEKDAE